MECICKNNLEKCYTQCLNLNKTNNLESFPVNYIMPIEYLIDKEKMIIYYIHILKK